MLLTTLEGRFSKAATDFQHHVQDAVDQEFGQSPSPFIVQPFCRPVSGAPNQFTVIASVLGVYITEDLTNTSLDTLDSAGVMFRNQATDKIIDAIKKIESK